ncbi:hypothetical protein, partial [Collinsella sp. AF29-7AC]|uniref:hypothetical protein n=1 Tax=Collinsella sp. AF29-7AC TaxID=2292010 RepID=UPI001F21CAD4
NAGSVQAVALRLKINRWAVTPGRYPPIFIEVSRPIHIVMGVYPKGNQINTPITKEFSIPTQ